MPGRQIDESELKTLKAEVMFTELVAKLNLPLTVSDAITKTCKAAFPDSKIAQNYACGRSKATSILKALSTEIKNDLVDIVKMNPFCLSNNDGSNDKRDKQFPMVLTYADIDLGVLCRLLSVPILQAAATGRFHVVTFVGFFAGHGSFSSFAVARKSFSSHNTYRESTSYWQTPFPDRTS
jgi:hypothetical protein